MKYLTLTLTQFNAISPTDSEQFLSDSDGTANLAGAYTTNYVGYASPQSGSKNESIIKRVITNNTSGDLVIAFAYKVGEVNSLTMNKEWSNRASFTYQNFKL